MPILRLFYILKINLPFIIFGAALGILLGALSTVNQTPYFTAKAQIFVSTPATQLDIVGLAQGSNFSQQRVKSYARIISSPLTLEPVIKKLGISDSYDEIAKRLKSSVPLDTVLIDISYSDKDPVKAANIVNAIGLQFSKTASSIEFGDSAQGIKVTLVKFASPPTHPSTPKTKLNLLVGLLLGGFLGLSIKLINLLFDTSLKNERQLDGKKLIGTIVFDKSASNFPVTTSISKYSPRTESFRQLRTNLIHNRFSDGSEPQVLLITSATSGEGKSTSAINIAVSFGEANYRTILIEGDLRRPSFGKYVKESKSSLGLSNILKNKSTVSSAKSFNKYISKSTFSNVDILFSGPLAENPAELLGGGNFEELVLNLRNLYDKIIIDSPPLLPVTDAAVIAPFSDGIVLMVKAGKTKISQLRAAVGSLEAVSGVILGVVFNMIPVGTRDYMNYGYEHGYVSPYIRDRRRSEYDYTLNYGTNEYYEKISAEAPYAPNIEELKKMYPPN